MTGLSVKSAQRRLTHFHWSFSHSPVVSGIDTEGRNKLSKKLFYPHEKDFMEESGELCGLRDEEVMSFAPRVWFIHLVAVCIQCSACVQKYFQTERILTTAVTLFKHLSLFDLMCF